MEAMTDCTVDSFNVSAKKRAMFWRNLDERMCPAQMAYDVANTIMPNVVKGLPSSRNEFLGYVDRFGHEILKSCLVNLEKEIVGNFPFIYDFSAEIELVNERLELVVCYSIRYGEGE